MLLATYIKCISAQSAKRTVDLGQVMESLLQSSLKRAPLQARNRTFGSPHTICASKTCLPIKVVCCRRETAAFCWLQTACARCDWQHPAACKIPPTARRRWPAVKRLQAALTPLLAFRLKGPSLLGPSQTQKPSPLPPVYSSNLVCIPNGTLTLDATTALSRASQTSCGLPWGRDLLENTQVLSKL